MGVEYKNRGIFVVRAVNERLTEIIHDEVFSEMDFPDTPVVNRRLSLALRSKINGVLNGELPGVVPYMFTRFGTLDEAMAADPKEVAQEYHAFLKQVKETKSFE